MARRIWNPENGKELCVLKGHEDWVSSAAFSPDGKLIVSASADNTVRIWNAENGKELSVLKGHTQGVSSAAFSPDGKLIASASVDNTVRIWNKNINHHSLFLKNSRPTDLYRTFIQGAKFFWRIKRQEFKLLDNTRYTLYNRDGYNLSCSKKFRPLLDPPAKGQNKFDQILEWAEAQQQ